ncbi:hypothetical protein AKJ40_04880 [candidate division MSBL1 archaeon SCGC-AAA259M10]|uniref:Uncharacterized protein n=1 Tax=candidate division MSBL1 archaeon SCGC-AAA259M10 TaxID=1698270 RepID=A0A133UVI0_9EURY|nr:hypothetical protein AKJ40_04880 [candidate division MSBL1 archaeon SCGC-AAA259M10]
MSLPEGEDHGREGGARTELGVVELRSTRRGGKVSLHFLVWRRYGLSVIIRRILHTNHLQQLILQFFL